MNMKLTFLLINFLVLLTFSINIHGKSIYFDEPSTNLPPNITRLSLVSDDFNDDCLNAVKRLLAADFKVRNKGAKLKRAIYPNGKNVDQDLVRAYAFVASHSQIRLDVPTLRVIASLQTDPAFLSLLPNGATDLRSIIAAAKNPLEATANTRLVDLKTHLSNLREFTIKHNSAIGFDRFLVDLKNSSYSMQDGASHMLNDISKLPQNSIYRFDYEFAGDGVVCTRCKFDVELHPNSQTSLRFLEYKSWSLDNIKNIKKRQLVEYFRAIDDISEMRYIFNELKTPDIVKVRIEVAKLLYLHANDVYGAMSSSLKGNLGINSLNQFKGLITNGDQTLFSFVKIK